jgi:hypothetical protein
VGGGDYQEEAEALVNISSSSMGSGCNSSMWDDECGVCGEGGGQLLCCEGGDCTAVYHKTCIGLVTSITANIVVGRQQRRKLQLLQQLPMTIMTTKMIITITTTVMCDDLQVEACAPREVCVWVVQRQAAVEAAGKQSHCTVLMLLLFSFFMATTRNRSHDAAFLIVACVQVEKMKCKLLDLEAKQSDDCDTSEGGDSLGLQTQVCVCR